MSKYKLQNGAIESVEANQVVASEVVLKRESGFMAKVGQKLTLKGSQWNLYFAYIVITALELDQF